MNTQAQILHCWFLYYSSIKFEILKRERGGAKMKKLINIKRVLLVVMILLLVVILQSCVVYQNPYTMQQVPVSDIVQMSKSGLSSKDIISQIRQTRSVYGLNAAELAKIRDEGVSDSVINYMENTHFDAINRSRQMYYPNYGWDNGYGYYGGFGWPDYGYGWGWGPTIVYRNYGGFHGGREFHEGGGFHGGHGDKH